jgi:hypothetical protein
MHILEKILWWEFLIICFIWRSFRWSRVIFYYSWAKFLLLQFQISNLALALKHISKYFVSSPLADPLLRPLIANPLPHLMQRSPLLLPRSHYLILHLSCTLCHTLQTLILYFNLSLNKCVYVVLSYKLILQCLPLRFILNLMFIYALYLVLFCNHCVHIFFFYLLQPVLWLLRVVIEGLLDLDDSWLLTLNIRVFTINF